MSDTEEQAFNPMDFSNIPGAIDPSTLVSAKPTDMFSSTPGAISAESLILPEVEEFRPVAIPAPVTGAPISPTGQSKFDNEGVTNFLSNYGGKKKKAAAPELAQESLTSESLASLSKEQQAQMLQSLFGGGRSAEEDEEEEYVDDSDTAGWDEDEEDYEEDYEDDEDYGDEEDYEDDEDGIDGCQCTLMCPNTDCAHYGKDNYVSLEEIIENEVDRRLKEILRSQRPATVTKAIKPKPVVNKYLHDMKQYL